MTPNSIEDRIRAFVLGTLLKREDPARLTATTPLISSGLLDSIAVTELLMFLEDALDARFDPGESDPSRFDTLELIARAVRQKKGLPADA